MTLDPDDTRRRLEPLFEENFARYGELGAAVSVWQHGRELVHLHGGFRDAHREVPWSAETLVLVWSATKGLASACLLHALQERRLGLEQRVAEFWPEFAQAGKGGITIAQLMSHQAGLAAIDCAADVLDYPAVIAALEAQPPLWPPAEGHGYHARTFGFLIDELLRRVSGRTVSDYWRAELAEPLALDIWIGLPAAENARVATMYAAKMSQAPPEPAGFYRELATPGTLVRKTFTSPAGLHAVSAMNAPAVRAVPIASLGGIAQASSLAKFYAMLANGGELEGRRFFTAESLAWMTTTLAAGIDRVFQIPTAFSAGFMKNPPAAARQIFGPGAGAFGHPGAGGSQAFADPANGLAFAYVMNQMQQALLPNEKSLRLIHALYGESN